MATYPQQYLDQIKQFGFTDPKEYEQAYNSTNNLNRQARQKEYSAQQNMFGGNTDEAARNRMIASGTIPSNSPMAGMSQKHPVVDNTSAFSKDFNVDGLDLGLPQRNPMDFMGSFAPKEAPPIDMNDPFGSNQQNTAVQSPILKASDTPDADGKSKFIQQYLEQSTNNALGMQGNQSQNAAIDYNNRLTAGIARGANSRQKGSSTPEYQKAVAYTPQAMNFGNTQQQASNPYLGMFDGNGISVAPSKNTVYPQGMEMSQNGKSLFDSNRNLLPNPELSNSMKKYFGG